MAIAPYLGQGVFSADEGIILERLAAGVDAEHLAQSAGEILRLDAWLLVGTLANGDIKLAIIAEDETRAEVLVSVVGGAFGRKMTLVFSSVAVPSFSTSFAEATDVPLPPSRGSEKEK